MGNVVYGGPYAYEVDAIRDERVRAAAEDRDPDFGTLFAGHEISQGAIDIINDIENPVPPFQGNDIENVVIPATDASYVFPGDGGKNIIDDETAE